MQIQTQQIGSTANRAISETERYQILIFDPIVSSPFYQRKGYTYYTYLYTPAAFPVTCNDRARARAYGRNRSLPARRFSRCFAPITRAGARDARTVNKIVKGEKSRRGAYRNGRYITKSSGKKIRENQCRRCVSYIFNGRQK